MPESEKKRGVAVIEAGVSWVICCFSAMTGVGNGGTYDQLVIALRGLVGLPWGRG